MQLDVTGLTPIETVPDAGLTALSPSEEVAFQEWYGDYSTKAGVSADPDDPRHFYDYRGAWKADKGVPVGTPGSSFQVSPYDQRIHGPSKNPATGKSLKLPGHPTIWKQEFLERTGQDPDAIGIKSEEEAKLYGAGSELDVSGLKPLDVTGLTEVKEKPHPISRGFVSGLLKQNPPCSPRRWKACPTSHPMPSGTPSRKPLSKPTIWRNWRRKSTECVRAGCSSPRALQKQWTGPGRLLARGSPRRSPRS